MSRFGLALRATCLSGFILISCKGRVYNAAVKNRTGENEKSLLGVQSCASFLKTGKTITDAVNIYTNSQFKKTGTVSLPSAEQISFLKKELLKEPEQLNGIIKSVSAVYKEVRYLGVPPTYRIVGMNDKKCQQLKISETHYNARSTQVFLSEISQKTAASLDLSKHISSSILDTLKFGNGNVIVEKSPLEKSWSFFMAGNSGSTEECPDLTGTRQFTFSGRSGSSTFEKLADSETIKPNLTVADAFEKIQLDALSVSPDFKNVRVVSLDFPALEVRNQNYYLAMGEVEGQCVVTNILGSVLDSANSSLSYVPDQNGKIVMKNWPQWNRCGLSVADNDVQCLPLLAYGKGKWTLVRPGESPNADSED